MHKKRNTAHNLTYDMNIIAALKNLPVPLKTFDGNEVYFDEDKRNETIFEHIANKYHRLHVIDIQKIPEILKNKTSLKEDRYGGKFRTYIGLRGKKSEKPNYLRIVTNIKSNKKESVVKIYPYKK